MYKRINMYIPGFRLDFLRDNSKQTIKIIHIIKGEMKKKILNAFNVFNKNRYYKQIAIYVMFIIISKSVLIHEKNNPPSDFY